MEGSTVLTFIVGPVVTFLLGGGAVSLYSAHKSAKHQVSGDEREARRDTVADRDAFIQNILNRLKAVEDRLDAEQEQRRREIAVSQGRSDHIDLLEAHIWKGLAPPPPQRPEGI